MSECVLKTETHHVGGLDYDICSLLDANQFEGDDASRAAGIPDAYWSFFGLLWASGIELATHLAAVELDGARVLELGCGLALPGIVAYRLGADMTVSDVHPQVEPFLRRNLALNGLGAMPYLDLDWTRQHPHLGRFDRIVASDVCYLPEHPDELADFIERHGTDEVQVVIADPGRPAGRPLSRVLQQLGFSGIEHRPRLTGRLRITTYHR